MVRAVLTWRRRQATGREDYGSSGELSSNISSPLSQDSTRQNSTKSKSLPSSPDKFGLKRGGTEKLKNVSNEVDVLTNKLAVRAGGRRACCCRLTQRQTLAEMEKKMTKTVEGRKKVFQ